jgi:cobalt-zinc-cadmium efflux system protein
MIPSDHQPEEERIERRLAVAFVLVFVFMGVEAAGGWLSGSLALLADAGHMLTDALALALAFAGFWFGRRPADSKRSYGYRRFEVLAAWINGILLSGIALGIMIEAAMRLLHPNPVEAGPMLAIATIGLLVNLFTLWFLRHGASDHINLRGAILHVIGDLLGSCAAIAAALVILGTGWTPIDPLLSLVIALLILRSAAALVRGATHILLEGTPDELDLDHMRDEVTRSVPAVTGVHHIHAWSLTSGQPMLTLHVSLAEGADRDAALKAIKDKLLTAFRISHSVVQIETGPCPDAHEQPRRRAAVSMIAACAIALSAAPAWAESATHPVTVFAAASLHDAVDAISDSYAAAGHEKVTPVYAASSALARQIENGAPADLFISADQQWMDYLESRGLILASTRVDFLGNRLVLIAPRDAPLKLSIAPGFPLAQALGDGRLAIADPAHVPAGIYAKAALMHFGVWESVKNKTAPAADARAALVLVERGETPAGIVYATDAAASKKVAVVGSFPEDSHPPIIYPLALMKGAGDGAEDFYRYLRSGEARSMFARFGFTVH